MLSRISSALREEGEGAFYLGRVDVAVTAAMATAATAEATPAGASLLDSTDLRAHDRNTLAQALALAPGVSFTRIGSRNETTVYVRGFDMRQVPLFIDGIPIYTPYDGYADLTRFTTFDVSEVQVSKGFTSVLYGPNTLGGAINIVSRRPSGKIDGIAGGSYGSGPAGQGYLNLGTTFGQFYLQGGASYMRSATFPLADGFTPVAIQPSGDRVNAEARDARFNVKLGWTPNGTDEYAISYVGQRGEKGNPPYAGTDTSVKIRYWQWPYWDKDSVYVIANKHLGSASYLRVRGFYDTYDNALYAYDDKTYTTQNKSSSFQSLYADHTYGGSVEWGTTIGQHTLRAAGHVKRDEHEDHNVGSPASHFDGRIFSVGAEDTWLLASKLSLVAGLGIDWQSTGRAETYNSGQLIDLLSTCQARHDLLWQLERRQPAGRPVLCGPDRPGEVHRVAEDPHALAEGPLLVQVRHRHAEPGPQGRARRDGRGRLSGNTRLEDVVPGQRVPRPDHGPHPVGLLAAEPRAEPELRRGVQLRRRTRHAHAPAAEGRFRRQLHLPAPREHQFPDDAACRDAEAQGPGVARRHARGFRAGRRQRGLRGGPPHAERRRPLPRRALVRLYSTSRASGSSATASTPSWASSMRSTRYYWRADGYPEPGRTVQATLRWMF